MARGAWEATDHGVAESDTTEHAHTHKYIHARQQKRLKYSLNTKTIIKSNAIAVFPLLMYINFMSEYTKSPQEEMIVSHDSYAPTFQTWVGTLSSLSRYYLYSLL